jgi:hypothetical protein
VFGRTLRYLVPRAHNSDQMIVAARRSRRPLDRGSNWLPVAQLIGASLDPINSEYEVKDAAKDWRKPSEADSTDGGADITLVEQHV